MTQNAFMTTVGRGDAASSVLLLFAKVAMANHTCWPNCSSDMFQCAERGVACGGDHSPVGIVGSGIGEGRRG